MHAKKQPFRGNGNATHRPFKQLQRNPLKPIKKALLRTYEASLGHGWEYPVECEGTLDQLISLATSTTNVDKALIGKGFNFRVRVIKADGQNVSAISEAQGVDAPFQLAEADLNDLYVFLSHIPVDERVQLTVEHDTPYFYGLTTKVVGIYNIVIKEGNTCAIVSNWNLRPAKQHRVEDIKKFFKGYTLPLADNLGKPISRDEVIETLEKWSNV